MINIQRVNYITILRKKWSHIGKLRTSELVRKKLKWSYINRQNHQRKGKLPMKWKHFISAIFVVNKQRKHSWSFGLTSCCPWPLIGKVFLRYRKTDGDDYEPDTLSGLHRSIQRLLSEVRSPFTPLSPFKRQLVTSEQYSSQHQQILLL